MGVALKQHDLLKISRTSFSVSLVDKHPRNLNVVIFFGRLAWPSMRARQPSCTVSSSNDKQPSWFPPVSSGIVALQLSRTEVKLCYGYTCSTRQISSSALLAFFGYWPTGDVLKTCLVDIKLVKLGLRVMNVNKSKPAVPTALVHYSCNIGLQHPELPSPMTMSTLGPSPP